MGTRGVLGFWSVIIYCLWLKGGKGDEKMIRKFIISISVLLALGLSDRSWAGAIFLTGHDPDFHASLGGNFTGARNINNAAIDFILDAAFNPFAAGAASKFIFVESKGSVPSGHTRGVNGIIASGYSLGTDFVHHDFTTLGGALDQLGSVYSGIVVASDFGGLLRQAELDILNARSADIIGFLNDGGGLYAMAQSNGGAGLTPNGGRYGFLPFVASSTPANQTESGITLSDFGLGLGLLITDVNGNFSHNIFDGDFGLSVVDRDASGRILSLAGRGSVDTGGVSVIPLPAALPLFLTGLAGLGLLRRRKRKAAA